MVKKNNIAPVKKTEKLTEEQEQAAYTKSMDKLSTRIDRNIDKILKDFQNEGLCIHDIVHLHFITLNAMALEFDVDADELLEMFHDSLQSPDDDAEEEVSAAQDPKNIN